MAMMRANPRLQVGSAPWISEERASAMQIAETEAEEFTFSARNEVEWLNEHMAEIFSENNVNVAEIFKTPGKLRGKTPRTARKANPLESRPPLSDVFSATPRGAPSPFKQTNYKQPTPTFQVAEDGPTPEESIILPAAAGQISPINRKPVPTNHFDSGYFGSQAATATQASQAVETQSTQLNTPLKEIVAEPEPIEEEILQHRRSETSFASAKEEQSRDGADEMDVDTEVAKPSNELGESTRPVLESPLQTRAQQGSSPQKRSPQKSPERSPERPAAVLQSPPMVAPQAEEEPAPVAEVEPMEDVRSPTSDGSSPIRPIVVRKSSLNFASLPAREPITTKKSLGNRVSRTSHLDPTRTSYYGRATGGKSLGTARQEEEDRDDDDMDVDMDDTEGPRDDTDSKMTRLHNKTSTQRLQDQISMLGQSQTHARPPSKSIGAGLAVPQPSQAAQPAASQETRQKSPQRKERPPPGAFPEDEEESWIGPPTVAPGEPSIFSPRPALPESHSTDVMEGIHGKDSIGGSDFIIPKRGELSPHRSPQRFPLREPLIPERTTSTLGHVKSVSTSVLRSPNKAGDSPGSKKGISVSNPNPSIHTINEDESTTPPKSPSRSFTRGSPLKAAKDKFSSILKTSRGLFASSAAVSADAKTSTLSPPSNRPGLQPTPSFEDVLSQSNGNALYPTLSNSTSNYNHSQKSPKNPFKSSARKTRASTEKEERRKEEQAREAREAKEAQKMADQLEKARMKVKEEARIYHLEQERVAAMQKEVQARKEQEQQAKQSQKDVPRATRTSPRKTKAQLEAEGVAAAAASTDDASNRDVEMTDASAMPPPAVPRPKSQIGRPGPKRPLKPSKEPVNKAKPPTVIRVDTGSQRGHQYHPSTSTLSATLQESLSAPGPSSQGSQNQLRKKASNSSIQSKASTNSFKSAASKALEAAARKKEQDELAAQRKREAKQEVERQRAANKEEERRKEEQHRRQEAERQREIQRERERAAAAADAKKAASRQAIEKRRQEVERAKQMGAPPPAVRPQPSGDPRQAMQRDKELPAVPVHRNDLGQSKAGRPQEELGRSVNGGMQNPSKVPPKRPLQQDDEHTRPPLQRNGPSYHNEQHSKRRKTSEGFDDDDMIDHPKMTAPPIRQSSSRPKDVPTKSLFPSGYANAPPSNNLQRSTLISQHNMTQSKPTHPMDMAQVSKGPIPFASSSQANAQTHKTPARPTAPSGKSAGKSTAKPSPKYQNGESIELPEINTDSEDSDAEPDSGKKQFPISEWANSPVLREQLARQETRDPAAIFGNPGPLNMEEVFSKSKDRFGKFRNRTSSANWSGVDRLTEDEIRKDMQARERLRRQGGWSYDSMV